MKWFGVSDRKMNDSVASGEWCREGKTKVLGEKPVAMILFPSRIQRWQTWDGPGSPLWKADY